MTNLATKQSELSQSELSIEARLTPLTTEWAKRKAALKEAQEALLQTEIAIYEIVRDHLPEKGTSHFGDLKIVMGQTESWDDAKIDAARQSWPDGTPFPFKSTWKADAKAISTVREYAPDAYKMLVPALTVKSSKPQFSVTSKE